MITVSLNFSSAVLLRTLSTDTPSSIPVIFNNLYDTVLGMWVILSALTHFVESVDTEDAHRAVVMDEGHADEGPDTSQGVCRFLGVGKRMNARAHLV